MNNEFPLHLERQYENLVTELTVKWGTAIIPAIKRIFKNSNSVTEIKQKLENLRIEFEASSVPPTIATRIGNTFAVVDAWALKKTKSAILRIGALTKEEVRKGILINEADPMTQYFIERYKADNLNLVTELGREYISGVGKATIDTFINGGDPANLRESLLIYTEGNLNKAKFWARDQLGDAYSAFTQQRQTVAGIRNYIWRTVGDNHVRGTDPNDQTSHKELNGRVFSWTNGAAYTGQLSKPGARHPGQDYNCRCTAEPTFKEVGNED